MTCIGNAIPPCVEDAVNIIQSRRLYSVLWWCELIVRQASAKCFLIIVNWFLYLSESAHHIHPAVPAPSNTVVWGKCVSVFPYWGKKQPRPLLAEVWWIRRGRASVIPLGCHQLSAARDDAKGSAKMHLLYVTFTLWLLEANTLPSRLFSVADPDLLKGAINVNCDWFAVVEWRCNCS